jgi:putative DNA primase/helicase
LIPDPLLRDAVIKLDHHLDAGNKDSQITAISHWIVEIGELDSSFRKDIARLKGFITSDRDKVRRPYGRADSAYQRRTVFCATVNDPNFLVDDSGNTRWWTIPVITINYNHGIDMQQVFAQLAVEFHAGGLWWLTDQEEELLEAQNNSHRRISVIRELVMAEFDPDLPPEKRKAMTATEVLKTRGIEHPSNTQAKECAAVLREHLGEPKRIRGQNKWRVPLREWSPSAPKHDDDEDMY